jgi:competence protein ComEA
VTSTATASSVTVHVVGQVVRPGVVRLPAGSRVTDAVARAGGPRPDADLSVINLARVVVDGEQVRVPKPGEAPSPVQGSAPWAGGGPAPPAAGGGATTSAPVNLNTAGLADLDQLPGVGPVLAQRILDWRSEHQRFASVDELGEVSGIGDKLLAQLRPKVAV